MASSKAKLKASDNSLINEQVPRIMMVDPQARNLSERNWRASEAPGKQSKQYSGFFQLPPLLLTSIFLALVVLSVLQDVN